MAISTVIVKTLVLKLFFGSIDFTTQGFYFHYIHDSQYQVYMHAHNFKFEVSLTPEFINISFL